MYIRNFTVSTTVFSRILCFLAQRRRVILHMNTVVPMDAMIELDMCMGMI